MRLGIRRNGVWTVVALAILAPCAVVMAVVLMLAPAAPRAESSGVLPIPTLVPTPFVAPDAEYDAVFQGDATGATDVTAALQRFLQAHDGQRVALAVDGVYLVSGLSFTAHHLTVDFRGARLVGAQQGPSVLRIQTSSDVVLNDPWVVGTGYGWIPSIQWEHGIYIDGGSGITLNRPVTRDTHGDGIYVGMFHDGTQPATGVVIRSPDVQRASRNGIAPVAGEVTITGGRIDRVGLHGVDFEVNNDTGASSIRGIVDGTDIRRYGDLPVESSTYAVAGLGFSTATKPSMVIQNLTGDHLGIIVGWTASVIVRNNVSDTLATARFPECDTVTFVANTRIIRE
ncbi:MAG: hypothetical protein U0869_01340 [Chloroflexota bacterium]